MAGNWWCMAARGAMRPGGLRRDWTRRRAGLGAALDAGEAILAAGGNALDAVEAAARVLEEDPCFNAGRGSVLAYDGHVELDAAIMDGRDRRCGAVAGLQFDPRPISAARAVMEQSPHVLMCYEGADDFACEAGLGAGAEPLVRDARTPAAAGRAAGRRQRSVRRRHQIWHGRRGGGGHRRPCRRGNVDRRADRQALGPDRRFALIGAGTYADDRAAAVSATGLGRNFHPRRRRARAVRPRSASAAPGLQEALDGVLAEVKELGGNGGLIAVSPSGEAAWGFTTPGMYRGMAGPDGRQVAVYDEELSDRAVPRGTI